jgi:hypothetical protein
VIYSAFSSQPTLAMEVAPEATVFQAEERLPQRYACQRQVHAQHTTLPCRRPRSFSSRLMLLLCAFRGSAVKRRQKRKKLVGMRRAKKTKPAAISTSKKPIPDVQEAGSSSPPRTKPQVRAAPSSPGRALRNVAAATVRKVKRRFFREGAKFLKGEEQWKGAKGVLERELEMLERQDLQRGGIEASVDKAFRAWAACEKLAGGNSRAAVRFSHMWEVERDLLVAERDLLAMQKAMLQRRVRMLRRR